MARGMRTRIRMHGIGARFVYILRSETDPSRHYIGRATNVDDRLEWHTHWTLRLHRRAAPLARSRYD